MATCPACGAENPHDNRFCGACGTKLVVAGVVEERKVVSVLFCDVVGFTEASEHADPEEVHERMRGYHVIARREIERVGGVVEKFIGDAVMAVFGAPVAHEDDAQRAIRAALAVIASLRQDGSDLRVRIGINTGEVIVALDERPEAGDGYVWGDVVNTAARLQTAAPEMAVVVGASTFAATQRDFRFEATTPVTVKGKSEPLPHWRVVGRRSDTEAPEVEVAPLVGRDLELAMLERLYERAATGPSTELVTIVGDAGMGKSRLVRELGRAVRARHPSVTWVRGRCASFGDGLAFAPLTEIVTARAGIVDTDRTAEVLDKIGSALGSIESDRRPWMVDRLASLLGLEPETAQPDRAELFTAWRSFLEDLAADGPAVAVIEDLHWADDEMVAFLGTVADRTAGVPLLVIVTARPEVRTLHPAWLAHAGRSTVLSLAPLADRDMASLVSAVMPGAAAELSDTVLDRAGGSPLYAEQLAAMVRERGAAGELDDGEVPPTVQALIAARLDTLPPAQKTLVQDAAVVGKAFWRGALTMLSGRDRADVESGLNELIRRDLVRASSSSSMEDEPEFAFWHALVRDVAYGELPRAVRMEKHRAVAGWLAARGAGDDLAGATAQHYVRAAELAEELGREDELASLDAPMRDALVRAGDRALRTFAATAAIGWYDRAAASAERAGLDDVAAGIRRSRGASLEQLGRFAEAESDYRTAVDAAGRTGDRRLEAEVLGALAHVLWLEDRFDEGQVVLERALDHARGAGSDDLLTHLLYTAGTLEFGRGNYHAALDHHEEAIAVARANDDRLGEAMALHGLCETRFFLGPFERSLADGRRADELFRELGQRPMTYHNLYMVGWALWLRGDLRGSLEAFDGSVDGSRELGNRRDEGFAYSRALARLRLGDLAGAVDDTTRAIEIAEAIHTPRLELAQRSIRLHPWAELGAFDRVRTDLDRTHELSDALGGSFYRPRGFAWDGWLALRAGDRDAATTAFDRGQEEAGDAELDVVWNAWIELLAAEDAGSALDLRRAARRLAGGAGGDALGLLDWAAYGEALADAREGRWEAALEGAARVASAADDRGDRMLGWRARILLADALAALDRRLASTLERARARELVGAIASTAPDGELGASFLIRPLVASATTTDDRGWYGALATDELASLADGAEVVEIPPGGTVDVRGRVFAVEAGRVQLSVDGVAVTTIGPGELFGEEALVGQPVTSAAVAEPGSRVVAWAPERVHDALAASSKTLDRVIDALAGRIDGAPPAVASSTVRVVESLAQRGRGDGVVEVFPVLLREGQVRWLRPEGSEAPLRFAANAEGQPGQAALDALDARGLRSLAVHSTSWRTEGDRVVLTYLAVVELGTGVGWHEEPVARTELARGDAHSPPPRIDVTHVIEHGLRHLSWLARDDPVIRDVLSEGWNAVLVGYTPEPFRALGPSFVAPSG